MLSSCMNATHANQLPIYMFQKATGNLRPSSRLRSIAYPSTCKSFLRGSQHLLLGTHMQLPASTERGSLYPTAGVKRSALSLPGPLRIIAWSPKPTITRYSSYRRLHIAYRSAYIMQIINPEVRYPKLLENNNYNYT